MPRSTPANSLTTALVSRLRGENAAGSLHAMWEITHKLPGGELLFSALLGWAAPYSGSVGARVEELAAGRSRVTLADRARVRNHLRCIHAIALANLAEIAGNVALAYSLPKDARFIVTGLSIDYLKKARGPITAFGSCPELVDNRRTEYTVHVNMEDRHSTLVARASLRTLVGPRRRPR